MKVVRNRFIPFKGYQGINLFGVLFVREDEEVSDVLINHEKIHTEQMKEMYYIFFYVWYAIEFLVHLAKTRNTDKAYRSISFEREAYDNERYLSYLNMRKKFCWLDYIV